MTWIAMVFSTNRTIKGLVFDGKVLGVTVTLAVVISTVAYAQFAITNSEPKSAAVHVPLDQSFSVHFNQNYDSSSANSNTIRLWGKQTGFYPIEVIATSATLKSFIPFMPGEELVLMLTTNVASTTGDALSNYNIQVTAMAAGCDSFLFTTNQRLGVFSSAGVALGDLDGDRDLDAFVVVGNGCGPAQGDRVYFNNGASFFTDSGQSLGDTYDDNVALGDLDCDGDLDALVVSSWGGADVWLNDGSGFFTNNEQDFATDGYRDVELGDLDGDGDLDAFAVTYHGGRVWLNSGNGSFTDSGQTLGSTHSQGVALGDLDGDGDLDALTVGGIILTNRVWVNDGHAVFADSVQSLPSAYAVDVALGDFDGDGDLDAWLALWVDYSGGNIVLTNDGAGNMGDSGQLLLAQDSTFSVSLGDVDGDGDLDAFVGGYHSDMFWLNDGSGTFINSGFEFANVNTTGVALGDLDGDGDLDAFSANGDCSVELSNRVDYVLINQGCVDRDGDGIPSLWEMLHASGGLDPSVYNAPDVDFDGDGQADIEEYVADTDPVDADSFWSITDITAGSAISIHFESSSNRQYTLERNDHMVVDGWRSVAGQIRKPGTGGSDFLADSNEPNHWNYRVKVLIP